MMLPLVIAAVVGYFLGALPFGWLVARAKGINIFEHGSKNPGATNVRRVLGEKFGKTGKRLGLMVFFLDAAKGALATAWPLLWAAQFKVAPEHLQGNSLLTLQITGLVAGLVGHSFSCFTRFKGGKGVATGAGGVLVLMPLGGLIGFGVWAATFYSTRYVSLASILAAVSLPVSSWFLYRSPVVTGVAALIAAFVVIRHRTNIQRLLAGTESKFAKKKPEDVQR